MNLQRWTNLNQHTLNSSVLVAGEDEEEHLPHLLVDLQLGALDVGPAHAAGLHVALEASLEATLADRVRTRRGYGVGDECHADLTLEQLLGGVHQVLKYDISNINILINAGNSSLS